MINKDMLIFAEKVFSLLSKSTYASEKTREEAKEKVSKIHRLQEENSEK
jgi:hypothetical protein